MNDKQINKIMGTKKVFTPMELVQLGLYGGRSTVHQEIKKGNLDALWVTERRLVITRESIITRLSLVNNLI